MNPFIITLLTLIFKILDLTKNIILKYEQWKRTHRLKKQYKEGKKAVDDGNIDEINKILK